MKIKTKTRMITGGLLSFLAISVLVFVEAVFNFGEISNLDSASFFYLFGKMAGLIGFLFLSLLIFSGDTARYFDRFFGMDRIIKFQRKFSLITMIFILLHPIFFILSTGSVWVFIIPDFSLVPLALGVLSLYIFLVVMVASLLYKRISYVVWQFLHILTYILFFFSLYHAYNWGSDSGNGLIVAIYSILLLAIIIGMIYRTGHKIRQKLAGGFYVEAVVPETSDTFTLSLKSDRPLVFEAGQFCFLRLNKDKLYARHPFTISSSPRENSLCFTIRNTGKFTEALSKLKPGDTIIVDGPFGTFTVRDEARDLVFIAGGVGITPFMSIIKDKIEKGNKQNVLLLYSSKTAVDTIFKTQLDKIQNNWLNKCYILSKDHPAGGNSGYEFGHINKAMIEKYVKNINNSLYYICGPESMKNSVKEILKMLGVNKSSIIVEDFFW